MCTASVISLILRDSSARSHWRWWRIQPLPRRISLKESNSFASSSSVSWRDPRHRSKPISQSGQSEDSLDWLFRRLNGLNQFDSSIRRRCPQASSTLLRCLPGESFNGNFRFVPNWLFRRMRGEKTTLKKTRSPRNSGLLHEFSETTYGRSIGSRLPI
jgi:hypothetical protein